MRKYTRWMSKGLIGALLAAPLMGCESHAGNGALIGGAGGAGVGALIGSMSHARAGEGALIGGAVGAVGGAIVGNEMDRHDEREYRHDHYREYDDYAPPPRASSAY